MIILTDCLTDHTDEGANQTAKNLVQQLKSRDPGTTVITYGSHSRLSDLHLKLNPLFLDRQLLQLLRRSRETVFYIPFSSNTRGGILRTFLLSWLTGCPIRVLFTQRWPMDSLSKWLLRRSEATVLSLSAESHQVFHSIVGSRSVRLKAGVDTHRFSPVSTEEKASLREKYGIGPEDKVLLHVGHLKEGRNIRQLLKIDPQWHILLAVSATIRDAGSEALRQALEIRPNITILDSYISDIQQLYQLADVYFFPVVQPGNCIDAPLSVLEAAACGIPVVTTPYGEIQQFLGHEGFYFIEDFDPGSLQNLLTQAVQTPADPRTAVLDYDWRNVLGLLSEKPPSVEN